MKVRSVGYCLCLASVAIVADAAPIPVFNLEELVNQADLVVVGRIVNAADIGPSTITTTSGTVSARRFSGVLEVEQMMKGQTGPASVKITYLEPALPIGYGAVEPDVARMYFLKASNGEYAFASPYYPSTVALSGVPVTTGAAVDRALGTLTAVLESGAVRPEMKVQAAHALWGVRRPSALRALRSALMDPDESVSLTAASVLLAAGDASSLPVAARAAGTTSSQELLQNLRAGLSQGKWHADDLADLADLFVVSDAPLRRAAVSAIRSLRTAAAASVLARALGDEDIDVRYTAGIGLGELSGRSDLRPSLPAFLADQQRYIELWRVWASSRSR